MNSLFFAILKATEMRWNMSYTLFDRLRVTDRDVILRLSKDERKKRYIIMKTQEKAQWKFVNFLEFINYSG